MFHFILGYIFAFITVGFYYVFIYHPELCVMLYRKGVYTRMQAQEKSGISKKRFDKLLEKK